MKEGLRDILCILYREWYDARQNATEEVEKLETAAFAEGLVFKQNPLLGTFKLIEDIPKPLGEALLQIKDA